MSDTEDRYLAVKVRLYPTDTQDEMFRKTVGCCRFIYNNYLGRNVDAYRDYVVWVEANPGKGKKDYAWPNPPTEAELKKEFDWLTEVDSTALQQAHNDLKVSYKRFFNGHSDRPRFHKKGQKESFRCTMGLKVDIVKSTVKIGKNGVVRCKGLRPEIISQDGSKLKSITVSRVGRFWYASLLYSVSAAAYFKPTVFKAEGVGIDVGVVQPVTYASTTGRFGHTGKIAHKMLTQKETRRKRYQKAMSRKQIGSSNQYKARMKVARAYQKERNYRTNFIEQVSCKLSRYAKTIVFEDLRLANMTKSAKGTKEAPGKNVKAKSGLNRELLRLGLGRLMVRTEQKAHRTGAQVIYVPPQNTSRTCSDCGTIDKRSRESQSRFHCVHCGFTLNADVNAAKNILALGLH